MRKIARNTPANTTKETGRPWTMSCESFRKTRPVRAGTNARTAHIGGGTGRLLPMFALSWGAWPGRATERRFSVLGLSPVADSRYRRRNGAGCRQP